MEKQKECEWPIRFYSAGVGSASVRFDHVYIIFASSSYSRLFQNPYTFSPRIFRVVHVIKICSDFAPECEV